MRDIKSVNENLVNEAKVPKGEIYGSRTPVLKTSDAYLETVEELGFEYDSSIVIGPGSEEIARQGTPLTFPYTLHHPFIFDGTFSCLNQRCPLEEFR